MIFPVSKLIEHQDELVTVRKNDTVRSALVSMVSNDFSQLPVVDCNMVSLLVSFPNNPLLGAISMETTAFRCSICLSIIVRLLRSPFRQSQMCLTP